MKRVLCLLFAGMLLASLGCKKQPPSDATSLLHHKMVELNTDLNELRIDLHKMREGGACFCKQCTCKGGCSCSEKKASASPFAAERLHALLDLSSSFSKITAVYFHYAKPGVDECQDEEVGEEMAKALAQAREVVNRSAILFDLDFNKDVDWYFEIFRQLNHLCVTQWASYRVWVADLTNHFDDVCKERLARAEGDEPKDVRMPFEAIPFEKRIKLAPDVYLHKQMDHWNESKKQAALPSPNARLEFMQIHNGIAWIGWRTADGGYCSRLLSKEELYRFYAVTPDAVGTEAAASAEVVRCRCCAGCECENDACDCTPAAHCSTRCECKRKKGERP